VSKRPELIVMAGPNGSGKTSVTEQLLRHAWAESCLYINPDQIAQDEFGGWDSPGSFLRAAQKAEKLRNDCLAVGRSLVFETVFSRFEKVEFLQRAQAKGYFIRFFFVCTDDPEINVRRVARRVSEGGHDVPRDKIIGRYDRSIANCAAAVRFVDRAYCYDNSVEEADPRLVFRADLGVIKKEYGKVNDWARPIFSALRQA
jgi:predicted ABC-type ATPase